MENLFTVSKVFSDRIFRVPDYQRGYAWEEQHCQDFLDDLNLLAADKEHFLGLLILHRLDGKEAKLLDQKGQAYTGFHVVDGQQRLTTIVLLLDAMRREMKRFPSLHMMAQGIEETYIQLCDLNGQPIPKLRLNRDTHDYFFGTVLERSSDIEGPTIRSQRLLAEAKKLLATYLDDKRVELGNAYPSWLRDNYIKVAQQLTFVVYTVDSAADAGVVFETMNNRGKGLTELEKVKNYLLYLASKLDLPAQNDLSADVNDTWTHIFEHLMAADLSAVSDEDRLLRAHWLMAYDYKRQNWAGSRSIKGRFNMKDYQGRHPALLRDLKAYLSSLRNATIAYCDVHNPSHSNAFGSFDPDDALRKKLWAAGQRLVRLDVPVTFLPLLMAFRLRHPNDAEAYLRALSLCETFAFRVYRWSERPAYTGQTTMFRLAYDLYDGSAVDNVSNKIRRAILGYCSTEQFSSRFVDDEFNWYRWRGLKYFLYEYEHHLAERKGQPVRMPWEHLARKRDTIEHILPQTARYQRYWTRRFTLRDRRRWTNDIGNLTLTYDNTKLGNKPFPKKVGRPGEDGCYAGSKLFVEQQIARYDEWTPRTIQARRNEIAAWAEKRWHVEPPGAPPTTEGEEAVRLIRSVVTRSFVPRGQMLLYKALYAAGEQGLHQDELPRRMGIAAAALGGVLGGLGGRVNNTSGLQTKRPGSGLLVEWRGIAGGGIYVMRPELREAIEELPKLLDVVANWSVEKIDRHYRETWHEDQSSQRADLDLYDRW